ncbi:MAG TPA: hypothetical protein VIS99_11350 [Terrimicrobiaceae bacterium]
MWSVLHFGRGMLVHFDESQMPQLSTNLGDIPYYAGRTLLRMWIAFTFSLLFTLTVGNAAAKNRMARAFILPARHASQFAPARHRCAGRMAPRAVVWCLDHREVVAFKRVLRCYLDLDRSVRRLAARRFA